MTAPISEPREPPSELIRLKFFLRRYLRAITMIDMQQDNPAWGKAIQAGLSHTQLLSLTKRAIYSFGGDLSSYVPHNMKLEEFIIEITKTDLAL